MQIPTTNQGGPPLAERYLRVFILGIPLVYLVLLVLDWNRVGARDFDQFLVFHQLQYWNHKLFGFAKQWTPLMCSGLSLGGEPQVPLLSLSMALAYVLGPLHGLEVAMFIYLAWGWIGAYLYAGLCTTDRMQRMLAASLFIGNGFFICRIAYGHIDFLPFLALPSMLWLLHRVGERRSEPAARQYSVVALIVLSLGAAMSLVIDGAPVGIIHLLFWVGCYSVVLSATTRSALPFTAVVLAGIVTCVLDAGYLWPMVAEQMEFPRLMPGSFTNPLTLPWFALLPVRGKLILPATGNGHELSVFIGPVIALALWRYRRELLPSLPAQVRYPLIVVSGISLWLGMGSLQAIHVPALFSPFDWLRALPGFRSMGVTGRYWGFLALPLSLLGALALQRFAFAQRSTGSLQSWMIFALLLQFGFQIQTFVSQALPGRSYIEPVGISWSPDGEQIRYVYRSGELQGAFITPAQGVIDCYDNDDFTRAQMHPGSDLVWEAHGEAAGEPEPLTGAFVTWNQIRIAPLRPLADAADDSRVVIALDQAYHSHWSSNDCEVGQNAEGNMIATCDRAALLRHPVELHFHDPISALGVRVSLAAWPVWLTVMLALMVIAWRSNVDASLDRGRTLPQNAQGAAPPAI